MIEELGLRDAQQLLREKITGHLGCNVEGEPYVVPISYVYEDDCLYIHSLPGRKIEALRAHPRACLQVDEVTDAFNWRSVIAFGRYEEITDLQEQELIMTSLFKRLPHFTPVEAKLTRNSPAPIVFRLRVERMTGIIEHWNG